MRRTAFTGSRSIHFPRWFLSLVIAYLAGLIFILAVVALAFTSHGEDSVGAESLIECLRGIDLSGWVVAATLSVVPAGLVAANRKYPGGGPTPPVR